MMYKILTGAVAFIMLLLAILTFSLELPKKIADERCPDNYSKSPCKTLFGKTEIEGVEYMWGYVCCSLESVLVGTQVLISW